MVGLRAAYGVGRLEKLGPLYGLGERPATNCSCLELRAGRPQCRQPEDWCPLSAGQRRDAPPELHGALPCGMGSACDLGSMRMFSRVRPSAEERLAHCLRDRVIVGLGDSTVLEMLNELTLLLSHGLPSFRRAFIKHVYGNWWMVRPKATSNISEGPLTLMWHPHDRNWTLREEGLNLTVRFLFAGHWLLAGSRGGLATLVHPEFRPELFRLGLLPESPPSSRPHILLTGSSFHDFLRLDSRCYGSPNASASKASDPRDFPRMWMRSAGVGKPSAERWRCDCSARRASAEDGEGLRMDWRSLIERFNATCVTWQTWAPSRGPRYRELRMTPS